MQLPTFIAQSLGWLAYEFAKLQPFIPTYTHLIVSALFPIYAGAHSSLSRPTTAAKPVKSRSKDGLEEDEEDEEPLRMEGLSPTDALMFPILAGTTLAGLYFLLKWLQDPAILNKILNWYFATFSVFSVSRLVSDGLDVFHSLLFPHDYLDKGILFHVDPKSKRAMPTDTNIKETRSSPLPWIFSRIPLPQFLVNLFWMLHVLPNRKLTFKAFINGCGSFKLGLGIHGLEGLFVGLASVLYYNFVSKPWWLTNLMGFGFAYGSLQLMSPTTFWTGTLILSGLFFYDIYFVFFTPMMVTVAKSLDIPIKLLFPRPPEPGADPATRALSMLGLGDVVLPGIMIGLALRFDLHMYYLRKQSKTITEQTTPSAKTIVGSEQADSSVAIIGNDDQPRTSDSITSKPQPSATTKTSEAPTAIYVKAPYVSVAEGWGDRLWTYSFHSSQAQAYTPRGVFPKPYFIASIVGYICGMLATLAAMQISNHAQPALLYLVPGVLSSLWSTAYLRGEFQDFWMFSDALEEEADHAPDKDDKPSESKQSEQKSEETMAEKRTSFSSFFSFKRSEERSQRIEKSLAKHLNNTETKDGKTDGPKRGKTSRDAEGSTSGSTLFSFSITGPPPIFQNSKPGTGSSGNLDSSADVDRLAAEASDEVPRWSSGRGSGGVEEHTGKRQRLD